MSVEHWWNDTDRGQLKVGEENLSHGQSVRHKSHLEWPGIESGSPWREADELRPDSWCGPQKL